MKPSNKFLIVGSLHRQISNTELPDENDFDSSALQIDESDFASADQDRADLFYFNVSVVIENSITTHISYVMVPDALSQTRKPRLDAVSFHMITTCVYVMIRL